jgi:putative colanic acid biosynthesis acetyltransferase WcaF
MESTYLESSCAEVKSLVDLSKYDQSNFDRGRPNWFILVWWLVQGIFFPLSLHNFNLFRCLLLRLFGAKIGKKVVIRPSARFYYPWRVIIGDYSWIGDNVTFYSLESIQVGSHCVISQQSYLCTGSHDLTDPNFSLITAPITIGNGVWIATDCFIASGVNIGSNAVIGARSSVFKDIPTNQVAWGNPCHPQYTRQIHKK